MQQQKLYVIRKFIMARSAREAITIEKRFAADEVWLDDDWKKANAEEPDKGQTGFKAKKTA